MKNKNIPSIRSTIAIIGENIKINHIADKSALRYDEDTQKPIYNEPIIIKTKSIIRQPTIQEINVSAGKITLNSKAFVVARFMDMISESFSGDEIEYEGNTYIVNTIEYDAMELVLFATLKEKRQYNEN